MVKGFNSDLKIRGQSYHIQTEDWGLDNPYIVSRVFTNGAVTKTVKTPYNKALPHGAAATRENLSVALQKQHSEVIDGLYSNTPAPGL